MKTTTILYWVMTILVAAPIGSGGVAQIAQYLGSPHGVVPVLGYPMYFFAILGFWKVLGAIAILVPRFPRLKEWAYAGIIFDLTGAAASVAFSGGYGAYAFHVIAPLIIAGFCMTSWAFRPESRKIGVLFSTENKGAIEARIGHGERVDPHQEFLWLRRKQAGMQARPRKRLQKRIRSKPMTMRRDAEPSRRKRLCLEIPVD